GAHGLKDSGFLVRKYADVDAKDVSGLTVPASYKYLTDFETGVRYHMWHALALLGTALLMGRQPHAGLTIAAWCFTGGIVFFSGALYVLVIGGPRFAGVPWGMIAPIGGTLQLVGWARLGISSLLLAKSSAAAG
ncbi:MAG: DUF423 domain-containing protein, partial [Planctomycetaceae bacterium]|nr:DUF423 domain-containing protein [Planctomycetaceae bacterium]